MTCYGLQRWRDHTRFGYDCFVVLGMLGRNLDVLGKLLLAWAPRLPSCRQQTQATRVCTAHSARASLKRLSYVTTAMRTFSLWSDIGLAGRFADWGSHRLVHFSVAGEWIARYAKRLGIARIQLFG